MTGRKSFREVQHALDKLGGGRTDAPDTVHITRTVVDREGTVVDESEEAIDL